MVKKRSILIVDDNHSNLELLRSILEQYDYMVQEADNGLRAIELASKYDKQPDVILLDVMMPGMDGYQVCQKLKSDFLTRYIPIILLTVLDASENVVKGFELDIDDYITKPFSHKELIERIEVILRRTRHKILARLLHRLSEEKILHNPTIKEEIKNYFERGKDQTGVGKLRIFIVVKNVVTSEKLRVFLESLSHDIKVINSGNDLLEQLKEDIPDFILLEELLEGAGGLEILRDLRESGRTRDIPVLFLTNQAGEDDVVKALDLGADDFLVKPFSNSELIKRIEVVMRRKRTKVEMESFYLLLTEIDEESEKERIKAREEEKDLQKEEERKKEKEARKVTQESKEQAEEEQLIGQDN